MTANRLLAAVLVGILVATASAAAAESEKSGRAKFVKQADEICQPQRNDAKRRIAHGTRLLTKKHPRIQAAGREFVRGWRELRQGYRRVAHLPRPGQDHKRIAKWLRREFRATATGVRAARALRRHHFDKSERLNAKAAGLEQAAERPVRNFDFQHCKPL